MAVIYPPSLRHGAILGAISPAGPVDREDVTRGIAELEKEGLSVKLFPVALERKGYLAGSDRERAEDLAAAFLDPETGGIICTRGGYGSMRLLELLDFDRIVGNPKPFIGFSDLTALQWALWKRHRFVTFSGPQLAKGWGGELTPFSRRTWLDMLFGRLWDRPLPLPEGDSGVDVIRSGDAEGPLVGGNLAMLASLCGTADSPSFADSILLLEEIDEPLYRIDRMLTQLQMSGAFEGARGIILGGFVRHLQGEIVDQRNEVAGIIAGMLPETPLLAGVPYGHEGDCWTVPLGAWAELDTSAGSLTVRRA